MINMRMEEKELVGCCCCFSESESNASSLGESVLTSETSRNRRMTRRDVATLANAARHVSSNNTAGQLRPTKTAKSQYLS